MRTMLFPIGKPLKRGADESSEKLRRLPKARRSASGLGIGGCGSVLHRLSKGRISRRAWAREMRGRARARKHERQRSSALERRRHFGPHRPAACDAHDLDMSCCSASACSSSSTTPVFGLCRAEPGQVGRAHRHDRRPVRHDGSRELHRRSVRRPLRRHDPLRLSRRPFRPQGDLHLVAPLVLGRQHHGGAAARRLRPRRLALHFRRGPRPRDGDHRRLCQRIAPKRLRGRAFAVNQAIGFCCVPIISFLAYMLVPAAPLGLEAGAGWC